MSRTARSTPRLKDRKLDFLKLHRTPAPAPTDQERERKEIEYWRDSPEERFGPLTVPNILNKMIDAQRLADALGRYGDFFDGRMLELGAGQGWASCLIKRLNPRAQVVATDISEHAIATVPEWEKLWGVKLDGAYPCRSAALQERDASLDLVWCFGAAHHFTDMPATLREIRRVLKADGAALFLYEPSSPAYIHPLAKWRVNRVRPAVPEDLLIRRELARKARDAGLAASFADEFSVRGRGLGASLYYRTLRALPFLTSVLPCAMNVTLRPDR